jgi:hypothetical protein
MFKLRRLHLAIAALVLAGGTALIPRPSEATICPHYFCRTDLDCHNKCPTATFWLCDGGACQWQ